jgi:hypothetical protein
MATFPYLWQLAQDSPEAGVQVTRQLCIDSFEAVTDRNSGYAVEQEKGC